MPKQRPVRRTENRPIAVTPALAPLSFADYQSASAHTDHTPNDLEEAMLVSVLGILGEAGDVATLFKKKLRDGDAFTIYPNQLGEELGDILWYLANVCSKLGLSLDGIARKNLDKTRARWATTEITGPAKRLLDEDFSVLEQIPRHFSIDFVETRPRGGSKLTLYWEGNKCGDSLTDNAYFEDGYRFHDVFHLSYAAVLGWSPVTRKLLNRKRRSDKKVDEIEDGGRAAVLEEGIAALVFQYAEQHNQFDGVGRVDSDLLYLIRRLTAGLEVRGASPGDWEKAILSGYRVFRLLGRHRGGRVTVDLLDKSLKYSRVGEAK
jgi:NTP pyrophosphatase (non-canonical NTP hydrolase)